MSFQLTVGLYEFEVTVDGEGAYGEGYVNVTVKPGRNQHLSCVCLGFISGCCLKSSPIHQLQFMYNKSYIMLVLGMMPTRKREPKGNRGTSKTKPKRRNKLFIPEVDSTHSTMQLKPSHTFFKEAPQ